MAALVLVELTLAFIVLCADSLPDGPPRRPFERFIRAVLWPVTLGRWFTHRNFPKLGRFAAIVWLLTTIGSGEYVISPADADDAIVRRIVDAAALPDLLGRETAAALLEST